MYISGLAKDFEGNRLVSNMLIDNQSAIKMLNNYQNTKHAKHIDIKIHFVRDLVIKKKVNVIYVTTDTNIADMFTKSLCTDKFKVLRATLGMHDTAISSSE